MADLWTSRTELLLGEGHLLKLKDAHVLVVGLGGVGAYAAELICRAGVGKMTIVDGDVVSESNINRQLVALNSTLNQPKASVLAKRLLDINPLLKLKVIESFIDENQTANLLESSHFDVVVDAIDSLAPKVSLLHHAVKMGLKIVSSMGAGGKVDPSKVQISDISKTHNCRLARVVRKRLAKLGVYKNLRVVFTTEETNSEAVIDVSNEKNKRSTVGTVSYMPAVFGCFVASEVIKGLSEVSNG
jgi:tRNA threonylcarbamoyladenosine dehydratase